MLAATTFHVGDHTCYGMQTRPLAHNFQAHLSPEGGREVLFRYTANATSETVVMGQAMALYYVLGLTKSMPML